MIRRFNLAVTAIGAAVFALLLGFVNLAPKQFEESNKNIVISQTSDRVSEALAETGVSFEAAQAAAISPSIAQSIQSRIDQIQDGLDAGLDRVVADILASACKLDCE